MLRKCPASTHVNWQRQFWSTWLMTIHHISAKMPTRPRTTATIRYLKTAQISPKSLATDSSQDPVATATFLTLTCEAGRICTWRLWRFSRRVISLRTWQTTWISLSSSLNITGRKRTANVCCLIWAGYSRRIPSRTRTQPTMCQTRQFNEWNTTPTTAMLSVSNSWTSIETRPCDKN